MSSTRKILFSLLISMGAALSGCGGGSNNSAPAITPGACAAGSVYSTQYGCMVQAGCPAGYAQYNGNCTSVGNTAMSNCQTQPGQAPSVYTAQYGCLPQGNCPYGQGSYSGNGVLQCVPGQIGSTGMSGSTGCAYDQVMTAKGCLPQYTCPAGTGFLQGRCIPGSVPGAVTTKTLGNSGLSSEVDSSDDQDYEYETSDDNDYSYSYETRANCKKPKVKVRGRTIKVKYRR